MAAEYLAGLKIATEHWAQQSRPPFPKCPSRIPLSQGNIHTSLWTMKAQILVSRKTIQSKFHVINTHSDLPKAEPAKPLLEFVL